MTSYYECKRCFYKCNQKNDMVKHLNVKKICSKSIESFKYGDKDEELYNLSLIKHCINKYKNNLQCKYCNKDYSTKSNLLQHMNKYCKKIKENISEFIESNQEDIIEPNKNVILEDEDKCTNENRNIYIDKQINGNNNVDNSINNINNITNISFNINVVKSFDEEWSIEHLDNKDKLVLLLNNSKFTSTLENILENEVNLNVLIENNDKDGLVYKNNKLDKMNIKDIVKNTMEKLYNQLNNFKQDIVSPNNLNINETIINNELNIAKNKYDDYRRNQSVQDNVNKYITDIYQKRVDNTYKKYKDVAMNKEGF